MTEIRHCYFNFEMNTFLMNFILLLIRQGPRRENDPSHVQRHRKGLKENYSKTCQKRLLKNKQNKDIDDK